MYAQLFILAVCAAILLYWAIHYFTLSKVEKYSDISPVYLFWTGGYDSTARLCQLLLESKTVQPVYISDPCVDDDNCMGRKSVDKEKDVMNRISALLKQKSWKGVLLPTIDISSVPNYPQVTEAVRRIHNKGYFSRPVTQYERMAQVSYNLQTPIEVGVEKCGTGLDEATANIRVGDRLIDPLPKGYEDWWVFSTFRYPIIHLTKKDLLTMATDDGYRDILERTWCCWFPTKDGNACGKCNMCLERMEKFKPDRRWESLLSLIKLKFQSPAKPYTPPHFDSTTH